MFWLVTCPCHWTWCELLFWEVLRASEWRSRLAAATGDAAVLTGLDFHPGWSQLLPPPKSPHISFLWCCSWGQRVEGRLCEQGCARHGRAQSHLCSFLCSATATAGSERPGFLSQAPALALPCSTSDTAMLPGWGTEFLCACSSSCSTNDYYCVSISISEGHIPVLSQRGYKHGSCFLFVSLTSPFFLFFSFRLFGVFCELVGWGVFFPSKRFLSIAG